MPEANPDIPSLFDTPAGGGRFRRSGVKKTPSGMAVFLKSMEKTNVSAKGINKSAEFQWPPEESKKRQSYVTNARSTQIPALFAESNEWFEKATTVGIEKFA